MWKQLMNAFGDWPVLVVLINGEMVERKDNKKNHLCKTGASEPICKKMVYIVMRCQHWWPWSVWPRHREGLSVILPPSWYPYQQWIVKKPNFDFGKLMEMMELMEQLTPIQIKVTPKSSLMMGAFWKADLINKVLNIALYIFGATVPSRT